LSFLFGGSKKSREEKQLSSAQAQAVQLGISGAKQDIPAARAAITEPLGFFRALLSGDRAAVLQAFAPEVETLTQAYETGRRELEEFAPRGGGRTAAMTELPFRKARDIESLVHGARLTGAAGVEDIGQMLASLGLGELGAGAQVATAARGQAFDERQLAAQQAQQAGEAVGSLIALMVLA
jgi:hypothetical protein